MSDPVATARVRDRVVLRPRTDADLPALAEALAGQQPSSRYPFRWPLPFPVEQFLVRPNEQVAWVAELDGLPVGHVMVGRVTGAEAALFAATTGRPTEELAIVSVLFVALELQGTGVGGLLLDTAVAWIREHDRLPVLDVIQSHGTAVQVYRHRGWTVVGEMTPPWMPDHEEPMLLMALPG
ncbi:GNAT family N-acetyltransferase [Nocardioides sp. KIGAM211]|uniref:GNAT family N-acetyltransferase n=1 Tax=Nocardioides luti TaxID=2761101 RepID=A0A7X0RF26_9ACTN|nr:GNAT family N-acetyltransferase [Nocardioides luti]MBB6627032.1 GNAT family N-acetyltransferase [Nocardioides luti]